MQYSQGICASTARSTRSFIFGGNAVIGLTTTPLKSLHAPGSARSGTSLKKPGTNPNVFWMSARVVKGTVKARSAVKVDGGTFNYVEIVADAALKGPPAKPGERVLVFDGAPWFQHTHAAAIKAGVVSYADAHYATPIPDTEIKPGAGVIVFLRGEAPPPGFPAGAAFLSCSGCIDRVERAADVARMKTAAFGDPITLKMGEVAVLPDGLEVELKGHTRKRPIGGGTAKDTAQLEARRGTQRERLVLGDRRLWHDY